MPCGDACQRTTPRNRNYKLQRPEILHKCNRKSPKTPEKSIIQTHSQKTKINSDSEESLDEVAEHYQYHNQPVYSTADSDIVSLEGESNIIITPMEIDPETYYELFGQWSDEDFNGFDTSSVENSDDKEPQEPLEENSDEVEP